jgi:hypothetical protein
VDLAYIRATKADSGTYLPICGLAKSTHILMERILIHSYFGNFLDPLILRFENKNSINICLTEDIKDKKKPR